MKRWMAGLTAGAGFVAFCRRSPEPETLAAKGSPPSGASLVMADIHASDERAMKEIQTNALYDETYRPQFHFTPAKNWMNDPNGLVYYRGEYHLFFQHNPTGIEWGNMTWGHAVSRDLVYWAQRPDAIEPDALGTVFSGSAVVDRDNTAGFRTARESSLVAIYTAAGGTSPESQGHPFTQCLAYSNDRGRTWTKYAGNPVLQHIVAENRDPKIVWHAPTRRWIMALYLDKEDYALFASPDLKEWTWLQTLIVPGCTECPDFFEMPVSPHERRSPSGVKTPSPSSVVVGRSSLVAHSPIGDGPDNHKWVFTAANGRYLIGAFDGRQFTPEAGPLQVDYGANYYAVQTYSDVPPSDGRRIQIAWMSGGRYPDMPFNQQMSFPCALTLRSFPEGLRLCRWPVREIKRLYAKPQAPHTLRDRLLKPGDNPLPGLSGDLFDIQGEFELRDAAEFGLRIRGEAVRYSVREQTLTCLGRTAPLPPEGGRVRIRVLVDRTSLEVFGGDGKVSMTSCFLPSPQDKSVAVYADGGAIRIVSLKVYPLRSAWPHPSTDSAP